MATKVQLDKLKGTATVKQKLLDELRMFGEVSSLDVNNTLIKILESRRDVQQILINSLDPLLPEKEFTLSYARARELFDEYTLLLKLLRTSEKRVEVLVREMSELADKINKLESEGNLDTRF